MLRLSKLADYGVVILATLAKEPERLMTAARVAEITSLPIPTVSKLLKKMAKTGLLTASRGAAGGYRLARPPQAITTDIIVEAVDGPIKIAGCVGPRPEHCGHEHACAIHSRWEPINTAVRAAFSTVTLAALIDAENKAMTHCSAGATAFAIPE